MKVWDRAWIELATPGSAVRLASVARHATDCATQPGQLVLYRKKKIIQLQKLKTQKLTYQEHSWVFQQWVESMYHLGNTCKMER